MKIEITPKEVRELGKVIKFAFGLDIANLTSIDWRIIAKLLVKLDRYELRIRPKDMDR